MLSNRPYLLRAFHEWIVDSACTPILVLDATNPHCNIPEGFSEGGEIVFNISPNAVRELKITNDHIEFRASFSGVVNFISAPIRAVLAIYAEENGEGLFFDAEEDDGTTAVAPMRLTSIEGSAEVAPILNQEAIESASKIKPFLKLVE